MRFIVKLLLSGLVVIALAKLLAGVHVSDYKTALVVAFVLALLRGVVRPILIFLTLPITILTLGLFLLVINAILVLMADYFVSGFGVESLGWALLFSLLLSLIETLLFSEIREP